MAFQQGLSGLNTSSKALDVISNNIANASTVGFKGGQAQFADVYAASLGIGGASQVGIGAAMTTVQQQFSQGNISNSNNPLDMAINGSGFFRLQKNVTDQTISYTRNGQYHLDAEGYIINAQGNNLTGYPIVNGVTNRSTLTPVQLDTTGVTPLATGASTTNPGIQTQINFDDRDIKSLTSATPNGLVPWSSNTKFPPDNLNTFNYSTSITVYDQKGNSHALSMYFNRVGNSSSSAPAKNLWEAHFVLDNQDVTKAVLAGDNSGYTGVPTLEFGPDGKILTKGFSATSAISSTETISVDLVKGNNLGFQPAAGSISFTDLNGSPVGPYIEGVDYFLTPTGISYPASPPGTTMNSGDGLIVTYTVAPPQVLAQQQTKTVSKPDLLNGTYLGPTPTTVLVTSGATTYVAGTDYVVGANGVMTYPEGSTITSTTPLTITYSIASAAMAPGVTFKLQTSVLSAEFPQFSQLFPDDIPIDFSNSTLFGSGYDVNKLVQDGYPYGRLSGVSVSPDGVLQGNYSNGQTKKIAQIALVDFISPTGLASLGNNQWAETAASGQALVGDPGTGNRGVLQSSRVEDANVDLTQELVNMITQQRNYQANAQSIKTQDQIMQTLVNLR